MSKQGTLAKRIFTKSQGRLTCWQAAIIAERRGAIGTTFRLNRFLNEYNELRHGLS